ncbi:hypothetical protein DS745_02555 [Anaerobacillus alkaliphilus]|uniref:DUF1963 domain-containing protein n=1 Tax=Anaerobacillus alkaliphilus TaxID=1548597 RepID=A0A4Q0VX92_9BACI|nr:hypothetical protein [Anaerobacillus alkaliphilus]RXJ04284.1 hypothetical protein DS745_02555 [Anaerobacillus alkaliphilus]
MRKRYLAGWEIYLEDKEESIDYFKTHGVTEEAFQLFKQLQAGIELEIEGNQIVRAVEHQQEHQKVKWENEELPLEEWEDHPVFFLKKDVNGNHRIGGKKPKELQLPKHAEVMTKFQYIGSLGGEDRAFQWMNMEQFHIVFPLFECNYGVFFDYSNPLEPKVIEPTTFTDDWEDSFLQETQVEYERVNYRVTDELNDLQEFESRDVLLCGVPMWYQFPCVPRCPVTNEPMRFVCSIESDPSIKVINDHEVHNDILIFGDMGHLMVFYHPTSKVAFVMMEH